MPATAACPPPARQLTTERQERTLAHLRQADLSSRRRTLHRRPTSGGRGCYRAGRNGTRVVKERWRPPRVTHRAGTSAMRQSRGDGSVSAYALIVVTDTPSHTSLNPSGPPSTTRWVRTASAASQRISAAGRSRGVARATRATVATLIARIATNGRPGLQTVAGVLPAMSSELEDQAMAKPQTSAHPQAMAAAGTHDRVTGQGSGAAGGEGANRPEWRRR